jgi:hypothetical protein
MLTWSSAKHQVIKLAGIKSLALGQSGIGVFIWILHRFDFREKSFNLCRNLICRWDIGIS